MGLMSFVKPLEVVKSWEKNVEKPKMQECTSSTSMCVYILPTIFHLLL